MPLRDSSHFDAGRSQIIRAERLVRPTHVHAEGDSNHLKNTYSNELHSVLSGRIYIFLWFSVGIHDQPLHQKQRPPPRRHENPDVFSSDTVLGMDLELWRIDASVLVEEPVQESHRGVITPKIMVEIHEHRRPMSLDHETCFLRGSRPKEPLGSPPSPKVRVGIRELVVKPKSPGHWAQKGSCVSGFMYRASRLMAGSRGTQGSRRVTGSSSRSSSRL